MHDILLTACTLRFIELRLEEVPLGLTGLEVFKLLPKKNCAECGPPTCLGFAMRVASSKASPEACPYLSEEAKERLSAASEPPIREVTVGVGPGAARMGSETVLFRHDKRFVNPTVLFVDLGSAQGCSPAALQEKMALVASYGFERVGQAYRVEGALLKVSSPGQVLEALEIAERAGLLLLLLSEDPAAFAGCSSGLARSRPLIGPAISANLTGMVLTAKQCKCPLVISGQGLDEVSMLAEQAAKLGMRDLVLDFGGRTLNETVMYLVQARRQSLTKRVRSFGYPTIASSGNSGNEMLDAVTLISRYAGALTLPALPRESMLALLTWRYDIHSDPERPVQVESRLYPVGAAGPDSLVYITTNFSLTYYTVQNEVGATRVPSFVLPVDTDGTSVLTAWAAGKLTVQKVAETLESSGANALSQRKTAVIPGYVGQMAAKLREATGWKIIVGPQEASGIPAFARNTLRREW